MIPAPSLQVLSTTFSLQCRAPSHHRLHLPRPLLPEMAPQGYVGQLVESYVGVMKEGGRGRWGSRVAAVSSFHHRLFPLCSHQLHPPKPSLSDKASAAAQYYLSRARYSPLRSRHNGGVKVAFGSGAPRWPASKPPPAPAKHEPKQEAFRPQPFFTKPLFGGHPPAVGRRGADQPVLKKDLHPSYQDMRGRGWKSTGPCRPSVPSMVSGAAYHSALASTQRANIHGRTDWTSK